MTTTELIKLETQVCCVCGVTFAMPADLLKACRNNPQKYFYCPNGHSLVFKKSLLEQEIDKLKKEKEEAEQARYSLHNQLHQKEEEVKKLLSNIRRRNKRIAAGVCPCCNRTFKQLAEHMKTMHPEMIEVNPVADVHKKISAKK